eukprot:5013358-Pleurochrysis_carterae.AAC.2
MGKCAARQTLGRCLSCRVSMNNIMCTCGIIPLAPVARKIPRVGDSRAAVSNAFDFVYGQFCLNTAHTYTSCKANK